jgi:hypothetical protein
MSRLFIDVLAISVTLGLSWGAAAAADVPAQTAPTEGKTMWESCARIGETDRDLCMKNVRLKDSTAGRQCEDVMGQAQRRCLLDFLEGKRHLPVAK